MGTEAPPRYQQLADRVEAQIRTGQRRVGDRLDAIRTLAKREGVSINTVRAAMDLLLERGLVHSRPRIGLVVNPLPRPETVRPFAVFEPDAALAEASRDWLSYAILPDLDHQSFVNMALPRDIAQFKSFQRCYRQSLEGTPTRSLELSAGHSPLRQRLASLLAERGLHITANELQITSGCQHAMEHALRVSTQIGDTVAIPSPAFPGHLALLSLLQRKVMEIPMTPAGPDPEVLQRVMADSRVKALIINPICHNPTGSSLSDNLKRDIAQWATREQVVVIEDDICAHLSFHESHPRPIASFCPEGWVILVSSVSKILGDTERIGWCYPGRFGAAYMTQFAVSQISGSHYRQKALAKYLGSSRFVPQLRQWRRENRRAIEAAIELLTDELTDAIHIAPSSGGYSLWVRLPAEVDTAALRKTAKSEGIGFLSGEYFSLEPRYLHDMRLVVMPPFDEEKAQQLKRLCHLIKQASEAQ